MATVEAVTAHAKKLQEERQRTVKDMQAARTALEKELIDATKRAQDAQAKISQLDEQMKQLAA